MGSGVRAAWWNASTAWLGCSTSRKHTAPDVTPCRSSPPQPIIDLSALLRLAAWCQRRQEPAPGEAPWLVSPTPQSPPASPCGGRPEPADHLLAAIPPAGTPEGPADTQPPGRPADAASSHPDGGAA